MGGTAPRRRTTASQTGNLGRGTPAASGEGLSDQTYRGLFDHNGGGQTVGGNGGTVFDSIDGVDLTDEGTLPWTPPGVEGRLYSALARVRMRPTGADFSLTRFWVDFEGAGDHDTGSFGPIALYPGSSACSIVVGPALVLCGQAAPFTIRWVDFPVDGTVNVTADAEMSPVEV